MGDPGYQHPYRRRVRHTGRSAPACQQVTVLDREVSEWFASAGPPACGDLLCTTCREMFPQREFRWVEGSGADGPPVGWVPEDDAPVMVPGPRDPAPATTGLPPAALVEILDLGYRTDDTAAGSVIVPDCIRVNGMPLAVAPGIRITPLGGGEAATVTVTLYARRIVIAAEYDLDSAVPES